MVSSPNLNAIVTQPSQGDGEEVALTSVQPEDGLCDELQDIKDIFLSTPATATTVTQPSQGDREEAVPTSV